MSNTANTISLLPHALHTKELYELSAISTACPHTPSSYRPRGLPLCLSSSFQKCWLSWTPLPHNEPCPHFSLLAEDRSVCLHWHNQYTFFNLMYQGAPDPLCELPFSQHLHLQAVKAFLAKHKKILDRMEQCSNSGGLSLSHSYQDDFQRTGSSGRQQPLPTL